MIKPVKRISISEKDIQNLKQKEEVKQNEQPENYVNCIVLKPWGYEYLLFENESVAIWFLRINKDHSTSMHSHPNKKTSLTLLSGNSLSNTFHTRTFLAAGDSIIYDAGVFHSTKAISLSGISLIEVETPPSKLDLCRMEDAYGREKSGYEGSSQMVTENLSDYEYTYIDCDNCEGGIFTTKDKYSISVSKFINAANFADNFQLDPGSLYCVCRGALRDESGEIVVDLGETQRGGYLEKIEGLTINSETLLMRFVIF
ncbi:MAG TPA: hypothetical protein DCS48_14310 [Desulfovibrio sp.]|nr:hypothetical protein [Desulfovibrio sp.]